MGDNVTGEISKARHQLFLEALRHREQEVFRYLVLIGPALGGFMWLLSKYPQEISVLTLCVGSIGLIGTFLLGACYCTALGYNYRCLTFQIAKEEKAMEVAKMVVDAWPKNRSHCIERTKLGHYICIPRRYKRSKVYKCPWCSPPELISVFWHAFVIGIIYLTVATCIVSESSCIAKVAVSVGILCLTLSLIVPLLYGRKLRTLCLKEKPWRGSAM